MNDIRDMNKELSEIGCRGSLALTAGLRIDGVNALGQLIHPDNTRDHDDPWFENKIPLQGEFDISEFYVWIRWHPTGNIPVPDRSDPTKLSYDEMVKEDIARHNIRRSYMTKYEIAELQFGPDGVDITLYSDRDDAESCFVPRQKIDNIAQKIASTVIKHQRVRAQDSIKMMHAFEKDPVSGVNSDTQSHPKFGHIS